MKVELSKADQRVDEQWFHLIEIANTDSTTIWSDGTTGESPGRDPAAIPVENFYVTFDLKMVPYSSPPYSEVTLSFGYGGESKDSVKESLMKLIMKF